MTNVGVLGYSNICSRDKSHELSDYHILGVICTSYQYTMSLDVNRTAGIPENAADDCL